MFLKAGRQKDVLKALDHMYSSESPFRKGENIFHIRAMLHCSYLTNSVMHQGSRGQCISFFAALFPTLPRCTCFLAMENYVILYYLKF